MVSKLQYLVERKTISISILFFYALYLPLGLFFTSIERQFTESNLLTIPQIIVIILIPFITGDILFC